MSYRHDPGCPCCGCKCVPPVRSWTVGYTSGCECLNGTVTMTLTQSQPCCIWVGTMSCGDDSHRTWTLRVCGDGVTLSVTAPGVETPVVEFTGTLAGFNCNASNTLSPSSTTLDCDPPDVIIYPPMTGDCCTPPRDPDDGLPAVMSMSILNTPYTASNGWLYDCACAEMIDIPLIWTDDDWPTTTGTVRGWNAEVEICGITFRAVLSCTFTFSDHSCSLWSMVLIAYDDDPNNWGDPLIGGSGASIVNCYGSNPAPPYDSFPWLATPILTSSGGGGAYFDCSCDPIALSFRGELPAASSGGICPPRICPNNPIHPALGAEGPALFAVIVTEP